MPVESDNDRLFLLADFGVSATYTPLAGGSATINVIFDNEFIPVDTGASVAFAVQQPKATVRTADIPNATEGDVLAIDGVSYVIRVVMPDGTGITELLLEAQ